jgi:hypothetical protein
MKNSIARLLRGALVITVVAFAVAFLFRHAKHGAGLVVGGIAWYSFLLGVLAVIVLAVAAVAGGAWRRLSSSGS